MASDTATTTLYSDAHHVESTLETAVEAYKAGRDVSVKFVDSGQVVVDSAIWDELVDRNIADSVDHVCRLDIDTIPTLVFHQSVVDSELTVMPAPHGALNASQATQPRDLGDALNIALAPVEEFLGIADYDSPWCFAEVSAASIAHGGHLTDFEYEYEAPGCEIGLHDF